MRPLDVGVIGCGTAGGAAAVMLARAGHNVTVYERVASPKAVGAGITLQPTGLHVLSKLGLDGHILDRGARLGRLLCETKTRRALADLSYTSIDEELFGIGLHRGVLFEALYGAVRREGGIKVRSGLEIVDLARTEERDVAERKRGSRWSWFVDADRKKHGPHELVVVADGARSQLRDDTSTSKRIEPYPWGALWFVAREPRDRDDPKTKMLYQVVDQNHTFVGLLPTGLGPTAEDSATRPSGPLVSLFWSIRGDRVDAWRKRGLEPWKEDVRKLVPEAAPVLDQIHDEQQVLFAAYHDVVMHRWTTRNVVYLGDAAHATSPQLGQGCNLALWDAMTLAECLAGEEHRLTTALDAYSRKRRDHLAYYQFATRLLTPFFQGDETWLATLRDLGMPLIAKVPPLQRFMTLTMLGVVDGFGGRTLPLTFKRA